ncbi:hypothetical protein F5Y05DRAFT_208550 [Hypoxylon sp. FL0543]|nr:hypothetical protein F5Y05DRAFT_208550 [Hypoxylon sp. FL0543]
MTRALASQYRRAAHRQFRSHIDDLFLSEALLATAFERYCLTSKTVARYGSSVPGPIESRRRSGKRCMGELSLGQSHSAAPLWGLENLPDLTQWQWKPPSSHARLQEHQVENTQKWSLARAMRNLVHEPSATPSNITDIGLGPDVVLDGVGEEDITNTTEVVEQLVLDTMWDAQSPLSEIVNAGLVLLRRDLSADMMANTRPNFANFCNNWKDSLASGSFAGEAICSVLDGVYCGLDMPQSGATEPLERTMSDKIKLGLLQATIVGLSNHVSNGHRHFEATAWDNVLQRISELRINTIRVFTEAMAHIPESRLDDISTGVHANLRTFLVASGCTSRRSSLIRQVGKMAKSLSRFDLASHRHILEDGTQYVLMHRGSKDVDYTRMRLGWVQLLARLPSIDQSYLAKVCSILEAGKEIRQLSSMSICEMYLAKRYSEIKEMEKLHLRLSREGDDSKRFGVVALVLWQTSQFDHVKGLCGFLNELGRAQDVMRLARGVRNLVKNEAMPLASLAIAAGRPKMAIDILSLYEKSRASSSDFWETSFSTEALELLVTCQSIRHNKVLGALRLKYLPRAVRRRRAISASRRLQAEILKTAKAAAAFAISPSISSRTAFHLIWRCIIYLRKSPNSVVPPAALRALLHNVTRDLAEGEQGRTARLRAFLYVLHEQAGRDKMAQFGLAIQRWRDINKRLRRRGCMGP